MTAPTPRQSQFSRPARLARVAIALLAALAGLAALAAAPAAAKETRAAETTFSGSDSPGGPFGFALFGGVAVDNSGGSSAGDVYVGETNYFSGESRVVKFDGAGAYAGLEFNGEGTPAGSFSFVNTGTLGVGGVVVDGSSGPNAGDVYVADATNHVVDRFDEEGHFLCQISGKTPASLPEEEAECAGAVGSAVPQGGLNPGGIAVSPVDGTVYVGDLENGVIDVFNAGGEHTGQISDPHIVTPSRLATDSHGALYVANATVFAGGSVVKFDSAGNFVSAIVESSALAIAVDPATDHLFVYEGEAAQIVEYDESGAELMRFGHQYEFTGLGASAGNEVYAISGSFGGSTIDIYGPPVTIPDVAATAATEIEETSATLNGTVDPAGGGEVESCEFEYGETTSYGASVPCSQAVPFATAQPVSAEISGLEPSTEYHFRLVAANSLGIDSYSEDEVFYTRGAPTIEATSVGAITRYSAEVETTLNPHGYATEWEVEYVDKATYEAEEFANPQTTGPMNAGAGLVPEQLSVGLSGLQVETTYYYRVVAGNSAGDVVGPTQSFDTLPIVELKDLYPLGENTSGLLREKVNPLGLDTSCQVQYTTAAQFEAGEWTGATTAPCTPADLGSGSTMVYVRTKVSGLAVNTTYYSRFVISNASGTVHTPSRPFTTFGIKEFKMAALDEEGEPVTQAGAHPYEFLTEIAVNRNSWELEGGTTHRGATATLKDIRTEPPPGLIGNPNGLPQCPQRLEEVTRCPADTQVGAMSIQLVGSSTDPGWSPLFNLVPPKGVAAKFGAWINGGVSAYIQAGVRTGADYGIDASSINITSFANAGLVKVKFWGDPGDPGHTAAGERACPQPVGFYEIGCSPAGLTERPFLSMPTHCTGGPLTVHGSVDTYQEPENVLQISDQLPAITGCNALEFGPSLEARPTTNVADSPSGLQVDLHVPQNEEEEGLRTPDLRDAKVVLPPGLVVNPSGANGLAGCSSAAFDEHGAAAGHCPDASKVGVAEVDTPLVGHPLPGAIYVATPHDNPFDSLLAIYVEVNDPVSGVIIKLAGHVEADPSTGQLTTSFDENPQLPFEDFKLDFFKGAGAPLRTPAVCGTYRTDSTLTPWSAPESGPVPTPFDQYQVSQEPGGGDCPSKADEESNSPSFEAGTESPTASAYSPLVLHLRREDGSQEFEKLTVTPPSGLLAKLAGTSYCPDSALAAAAGRSGTDEKASPSCPSDSEIGVVDVAAGAGPAPYEVQGHAYLAGPYRGAPLSMAIVTPAAAGPYDLGTVVVRVALHVDPETTQITAVSDQIPHILQGIPLDIRSIAVSLNRNQFTRNPTSCDPMSLGGGLTSVLGRSASLESRFQVGDCTRLGFEPKLGLRTYGRTNRGAHPKLRAVLRMPAGNADISRAAVTLPRSEILDQGHIRTICTRVQYGAGACPAASIYGYAWAWSPLLAQPLRGPVYLRSSSHELPDLVASLDGQIHVDLDGRIDSVHGGIRTTFETVPDAPVSAFKLVMKGGSKGLLQNSTGVCRGVHRAVARFDAHSGAVSDSRPPLSNGRCNRHQRKKHRRHRRKVRRGAHRSAAALDSAVKR